MPDDDIVVEPEDGEGSVKTPEQKIKELRDALKKTEKERAEYLEGWQRAKADYINAKKRAEEGRLEDLKFACQGLIFDILPSLDSLNQALSHLESDSEVAKGLLNTRTQIMGILETYGLKESDPMDKIFDPSLHEPMDTLAVSNESEDNTVTKVYQKGYTLHGKVIRPARVQVGHYQFKSM